MESHSAVHNGSVIIYVVWVSFKWRISSRGRQRSLFRFVAELKNKLSFKASSKVALDSLLLKTFKFFDLDNAGIVPENEFYRTMAKVGVVF